MYIEEWNWLDEDVEHLASHGVRPSDVLAVWREEPRYRRNRRNRAASHQMIGPDGQGGFSPSSFERTRWRAASGAQSLGAVRRRQSRFGGKEADMKETMK